MIGGSLKSWAKAVIGMAFAVSALSACVSDQTADDSNIYIPAKEQIAEPKGMFPRLNDKRSHAVTSVAYYFSVAPERMFADPSLTFKVLSYFEWLVNDILDEIKIPRYRLVKIVTARDRIREAVGLDQNLSTQEAVEQLHSMSRFLNAMSGLDRGMPDEMAQRREVSARLKMRLTSLLKDQVEAGIVQRSTETTTRTTTTPPPSYPRESEKLLKDGGKGRSL